MKGLFITFEGVEGSGKTTIITNVYKELLEKGYPVLITREPGGIKIAEQIRKVILDIANTEMDAKTETLLFAAARRQHLVEKIIPALNKGMIVLCDRFIYSSLVYQGIARDLSIAKVYNINEFAIGNYMPDLTILLDVKPEIGLARIMGNTREVNRLDVEKLDFHTKIYNGYHRFANMDREQIKVVDASKNVGTVLRNCLSIIKDKLKDNKEDISYDEK
jgi:dTMP kinase